MPEPADQAVPLPASQPRLTLRSLGCTLVEVPLRRVLGTSAATVRSAPLLLVELLTEEGVTGRSYVCLLYTSPSPRDS